MALTVDDIKKQVHSNFAMRIAMNAAIQKLKDAEKAVGKEIIVAIIKGERKLTTDEFKAAADKFGVNGLQAIEMMERLNPAQKEYLMERMGYKE